MADTPDLSKIVSIIMQNPELIDKISSLVKSSDSPNEDTEGVTESPITEDTVSDMRASAEPLMKAHRRELLNAMKPYLSENRRSAIDSMSSILDVIDVMMKR